jgi:hypothetical protein
LAAVFNDVFFEPQMPKTVNVACVALHMNSIEGMVLMKLIFDQSAGLLTQVIIA